MKENDNETPEPTVSVAGPPRPPQRPLAYPTPNPARFEKSALRSKKFLGYFLSDLAWKALLALMILTWQSGWIGQDVILATVLCSTATQLTYLISQAWVDRSVRLAEISKKPQEQ